MSLDEKLLSAYFDGEVPSHFREKLEKEIEQSPDAGKVLASYHELEELLSREDGEPDFEASKEAVWDRIQKRPVRKKEPALLKRRVSLPLPLAAAAAVLIVFLAGAFAYSLSMKTPELKQIAFSEDRNIGFTLKVEDLEQLIDMLYEKNMLPEITIELPEAPQLKFYGKSEILRATDFSNRQSP
jgi:hypothetical protein